MLYSLLCLGIGVHVLLLYAIFDIYYSSPIVHGARSFPIASPSSDSYTPADRIVFFSADGLRASSFFGHPQQSPYLHGLIRSGKAAWGISRSHVPTESRPGHVALMAGFYEDVSAVTHGWKHNPVPFDNTINQSSRAYLWGSPDIVHLFGGSNKVRVESYPPELEDFDDQDAAQLDRWVFQRVQHFFESAKSDPNLKAELSVRRSILFLHLLGLDTNGHGHKPRSKQYLENIRTVDEGVRKTIQLIDTYFGDNRTAYLFTADHGMTDWGSHGDGTADEVDTPFLGWGSGLDGHRDQFLLAQVDIAPLQSALLGIAIPVNSFGTVPLHVLRATPKYKFLAAHANFRQMVEQYSIKRRERLAHSFRAFHTEAPSLKHSALANIDAEVERLAQLQRYEAAGKVCLKWIGPVNEALNYFHRYHRFSQGLAIAALFCAWNFVLFASTIGHYQHLTLRQLYLPASPILWTLLLGSASLVFLQHLPLPNYLYFLSPIFLGALALNLMGCKIEGKWKRKSFFEHFSTTSMDFLKLKKFLAKFVARMGLAVIAISLLVLVFFERTMLSVIFTAISPFFVFINRTKKSKWCFAFAGLSLALALFPLLPTVGASPYPMLVVLAEVVVCAMLNVFLSKSANCAPSILIIYRTHLFTAALLCFTTVTGFNILLRPFAWASLPSAILFPLWANAQTHLLSDRIILWVASLQLPFSMLSIGHEALFLPIFAAFLIVYVRQSNFEHFPIMDNAETVAEMRHRLLAKKDVLKPAAEVPADGNFTISEWLNALFLVASIEMAFFGTGNIASLNSFNPSFLLRFLSVFSPFTMAALLLAKVAIPFLVLALCVAAAHTTSGDQNCSNRKIARLSTLTALITNTMAMIFFCFLRTDGSWLQIGISISNYVICLVCSGFLYLLLHLANVLLKQNAKSKLYF